MVVRAQKQRGERYNMKSGEFVGVVSGEGWNDGEKNMVEIEWWVCVMN